MKKPDPGYGMVFVAIIAAGLMLVTLPLLDIAVSRMPSRCLTSLSNAYTCATTYAHDFSVDDIKAAFVPVSNSEAAEPLLASK